MCLQALLQPGLKVATKAILQAGIVCVGAKLSALEVMKLGAVGIPVVLCSITAGMGSVIWINARLGLPAKLGYLTAAGTSICGVTAITAVAPAIQVQGQAQPYTVAVMEGNHNERLLLLCIIMTSPPIASRGHEVDIAIL